MHVVVHLQEEIIKAKINLDYRAFCKQTMQPLESVRDEIEKMPKVNQVEILRILSKHKNVVVSENKNGSHVNLSDAPVHVIEQIHEYMEFVKSQDLELKNVELHRASVRSAYFTESANKKEAKEEDEEE